MKTLLNRALEICDSAEVYKRVIESISLELEFGQVKSIASEKKTEVSLRIVKGEKMGTAVATSLEDNSIVERAMISMEHQKVEATVFPNEPRPEVDCYSESVAELTSEDLVHMALAHENVLKGISPQLATSIKVNKVIRKVHMINSEGFDQEYDYSNLETQIDTLNDQGFRSASRSYSQGRRYAIPKDDLEELVALHKLGDIPVELGNERMPVIFDGTVMGALMLRVLGGVNGGHVVKGISPLVGKMGCKLFSEVISIRDDATFPYGCNSYAFDDEGTAAQNTVLYDRGVLTNYLTNRTQAQKLELLPTGNAQKRSLFSKEIEDAPSIFDSNLIIEGINTEDQALIKNLKRGLLITGVMGAHTGNIVQGDFSMNISSGFLIEEGVLVGKVKGAMIAGNIYDLFKNVEAIGTQMKAMKSIFYHMGYSPMVLFKEATIVGK